MQQVSRINLYGGGLNSDDSVERMSQADGKERWNLAYGDNGDGQDLVPANGHREIPLGFDLGSYDGEVLGSCKDIETQCIYAFVNVGSDHLSHILEFNANTEVISVVLKDIPFNGGFFRILDFPVGGYVSAKVMDGKLFFADGVNELRKLNVQRAKNYTQFVATYLGGTSFEMHLPNTTKISPVSSIYVNGRGAFYSQAAFDGITYNVGDSFGFLDLVPLYDSYFFSPYYSGYQRTWNQDQLSLIKPPCMDTIRADYYNDPSFVGNFVSEKAFKFSVKYIYYDYEESVWSAPSNIPLDINTDKFGESKNIYNCISINIPCPNPDVRSIRIACCDCVDNIWYEIDTIDVSTFNGSYAYIYLFYGNKFGVNIPIEEINKPYHFVPTSGNHIAIADNRLIVGNIIEDRDNPDVDIVVTPILDDILVGGDYLTIKSNHLIQANDYSLAEFEGLAKQLTSRYVVFSSSSGFDSVPPTGLLTIKDSFSGSLHAYPVSVASNGAYTVTQLISSLSDAINAMPPHYSYGIDGDIIGIWDRKSFVTSNLDGTITLVIVYGIRYYIGGGTWDLSGGGFDSVYIDEFHDLLFGTDMYQDWLTPMAQSKISLYILNVSSLLITKSTPESIGSTNITYPSGSAVSVGIGYYDHGGRFMPLNKSKDIFVPILTEQYKRWKLQVDIYGDAPSYASKYSIFQTESNISDKAQIIFNPDGEAFIGGITGDTQQISLADGSYGNAIVDLYLTGLTTENTDNGVLYWELSSGDGVPQLVLWKTTSKAGGSDVAYTYREKHNSGSKYGNDWVIPGLFGSGLYSQGRGGESASIKNDLTAGLGRNLPTGRKDNYTRAVESANRSGLTYQTNDIGTSNQYGSVVALEVDADSKRMILKLKVLARNNSGISGYVIVRTNMDTVAFDSSKQKIFSEISQGIHLLNTDPSNPFLYNQDEVNRYRFNISTYLNALKKYDTKDGYNPEVGDYVRVIKDSSGYNTNGELLRVTQLGDLYSSGDGYFQYAYIYTEKTDSVYDFTHGGIIELLKVKKTQQSVFYSEPILRNVVYSGGKYVHEADVTQPTYATIFVDAGNAYIRPRYLVKPNGDVSDISYLVEDFRVSDVYRSRVFSAGRLSIVDPNARQKQLTSAIRHGGRLLDETKVNKTCEFNYADTTMLDEKFGAIYGLEVDGNVLKVFQRKNITSIYIGQNIIKQANGGDQYVISDKVLDAVRPSTQLYGTEYSRSIVNVNGDIYFWDKASSSPCKATQGGVFPLAGRVSDAPNAADFKMARFFESMVAKQNTFAKSDVIASYSHKYRMVMFSFIFSDIIGNISPESLTIGFHEPTGRWFMKYNFVLDNFQEISSRSYTLAFDIANTPSSVPVFMSIFEGADALAFGNLSTERVGETLAQHGVLEVNANNPIGSRKIYDAVLMDMNLGVYYGDKNSRILTFDTPSSPTLKAQNSYVNLSSLKPEENRMVVNIPRNANTYAGKSAVQNMRNGDEMQGENLKITMSMNKAIFEDVPDYSIREIDVVTSSFR